MPHGATPSPIACSAAIPERTGDRVGRATAHRQDDDVHAVDAVLGTRERVGEGSFLLCFVAHDLS
jgi:hypothetical protein